jgi:reactive chlorine resistance protein C
MTARRDVCFRTCKTKEVAAKTMVAEMKTLENRGALLRKSGEFLIRYGLVIVLGWIGAMKFTTYEAEGIKTLVETSPFMSWMYKVFSVQTTSNIIGVAEITAAALIAIRPLSAKLSAVGSMLAIFTFLATLTFLFSLPGWEKSLGGFPALSGSGGFLLKDIVLLGAALFTLGDSLAGKKQ